MHRLKKIGSIKQKSAKEICSSRLGIGFEKLDRNAFDPEKASYYTLRNLASLFAGDIRVSELPITVEIENAPHCGNIPSVSYGEMESYGFRLDNGAYAYAYWIPASLMTTEIESAISLSSGGMGVPKLVDPMDGSIYELPDSMVERDAFGGAELHLLPIRDYPLFLVFGEIK